MGADAHFAAPGFGANRAFGSESKTETTDGLLVQESRLHQK
jgi:hypothetical protein